MAIKENEIEELRKEVSLSNEELPIPVVPNLKEVSLSNEELQTEDAGIESGLCEDGRYDFKKEFEGLDRAIWKSI